jgi:hypothetical protein
MDQLRPLPPGAAADRGQWFPSQPTGACAGSRPAFDCRA